MSEIFGFLEHLDVGKDARAISKSISADSAWPRRR